MSLTAASPSHPHACTHTRPTLTQPQVLVDPTTELTHSLLPKASHKDACRSFLFVPQNATAAEAAANADAEGRRVVAHSQLELEGWFWGLQCAATGPFAFKNDFHNMVSLYRETRRPLRLDMELDKQHGKGGRLGSEGGQKDKPEAEELLVNVAPVRARQSDCCQFMHIDG
jgi:hypothetical protein